MTGFAASLEGRRRGFRASCLALVLAAASCAPLPDAQLPGGASWREARALMGTLVEIQAVGTEEAALRRAADAAYDEMARLTQMMSHYDSASVVSAINRNAGIAPVRAPKELVEVLQLARRVSRATEGAFDITIGALRWRFGTEGAAIPRAGEIERRRALVDYRDVVIDEARGTVFLRRRGMHIDLGGIAKLYILDAGMQVLRDRGVRRALVNGGGDFVVRGGARQPPWRIGIHDPRRPGALLGVIELRQGYVVTSGDYERYVERAGRRLHHVIDPFTGRPTRGLAQVTLVGSALERVNGYSAALMVLGYEHARRFISKEPGLEGVLVTGDGRLWASPALQPHLAIP